MMPSKKFEYSLVQVEFELRLNYLMFNQLIDFVFGMIQKIIILESSSFMFKCIAKTRVKLHCSGDSIEISLMFQVAFNIFLLKLICRNKNRYNK